MKNLSSVLCLIWISFPLTYINSQNISEKEKLYDTLLDKASNAKSENNYDQMLGLYDIAIELLPEKRTAYFLKAWYYEWKEHDYFSAIENYSLVIAVDSKYSTAYLRRIDLYLKLGFFDKALADATKLIEVDEAEKKINGSEYIKRAEVKYKMGFPIGALQDINKAFSIKDFNADVFDYCLRGNIFLALKEKEVAKNNYLQAEILWKKEYPKIDCYCAEEGYEKIKNPNKELEEKLKLEEEILEMRMLSSATKIKEDKKMYKVINSFELEKSNPKDLGIEYVNQIYAEMDRVRAYYQKNPNIPSTETDQQYTWLNDLIKRCNDGDIEACNQFKSRVVRGEIAGQHGVEIIKSMRKN